MKSPAPLILASTSRYRRELLARLGLPFSCAAPGVDETAAAGERAAALVTRLARTKASAVAERHPDAWVIGSDQVAVRIDAVEGEIILGKPITRQRCLEQLEASAGQVLTYHTAVAVLQQCTASVHEFTHLTRVTFRPLDRSSIERYVERESPLDCAGGFKSEALGISLCESIETTDPSALIGLPLIRLSAVLRGAGYLLP